VTHEPEPADPRPHSGDASAQMAADALASSEVALPKELLAIVRRDPEHLPERLILLAQKRLGQTSLDWAQKTRADHPETSVDELALSLRERGVRFARINGALAGTPFFLALVPAYVSVLWEEARMAMCIAALNDRDPRDPEFSGELLTLRGLYETPDDAMAAIAKLSSGSSTKPTSADGKRFPKIRAWVHLVYRVLILAGFVAVDPETKNNPKPSWPVRFVKGLFGAGLYALTWLVPVTFMMMMSLACQQDVDRLGERAAAYYGDEALRRQSGLRLSRLKPTRGGGMRGAVKGFMVAMTLVIPFGLIVLAVANPVGHSGLYAAASFIGLLVVLALSGKVAQV